MQYVVVSVGDVYKETLLDNLIQKVNDLCQEGWKPQGGVFFVKDGSWWYAYQAMVK